jgi:hypothetical protein
VHLFVASTNAFRIMDKHLKSLSSKHIDTKFIRLDAEGGQHEYLYRDT